MVFLVTLYVMFQSTGPVLVSMGGISLRWYGLLIGVGILLAVWYGIKELRRRGLPENILSDMGFFVVLSGIIGARIYYVIFQWAYYSQNITEIFKVWNGGLAIHGALIGGFIAFLFYARVKKISWLMYSDIIIPGIALAQAVGRWGNFFNNEAFGSPTDLPWKLFIPLANRPESLKVFEYFHPTFLYESIWNLFIFAVLFTLSRKLYGKTKNSPYGLVFSAYLILYSIGRYFIEGLRTDSLMVGSLRVAQIASVVLLALGVGFFVRLKAGQKHAKHEKSPL